MVSNGMKKWSALAGCLACAATLCAADVPEFSRYQLILDRKPFGEAPPIPVAAAIVNPEDSFAKTIRMSALLEVDGGGIRIGIIDQKTNKDFYIGVGEEIEGIELISADYEKEEAVLRKGAEMAVIKLQSGEVQPLTPAEQQARMNAPQGRRPSYAERRLARQQQREQQPPPQPKYTGEELEKHLQEYQMEVIRQGLPPLPIPLTPEMDSQLVTEGVLPPVE